MQRLLRWFAFMASLTSVTLLLVLPLYSGVSERQAVGGAPVRTMKSGSLVETNGLSVLFVLAIPVFAAFSAVLPWPTRYRRGLDILGAVIVTILTVLSAFTIGLFFVPTAVALLVIAFWPRAPRPVRPRRELSTHDDQAH